MQPTVYSLRLCRRPLVSENNSPQTTSREQHLTLPERSPPAYRDTLLLTSVSTIIQGSFPQQQQQQIQLNCQPTSFLAPILRKAQRLREREDDMGNLGTRSNRARTGFPPRSRVEGSQAQGAGESARGGRRQAGLQRRRPDDGGDIARGAAEPSSNLRAAVPSTGQRTDIGLLGNNEVQTAKSNRKNHQRLIRESIGGDGTRCRKGNEGTHQSCGRSGHG